MVGISRYEQITPRNLLIFNNASANISPKKNSRGTAIAINLMVTQIAFINTESTASLT
ncbi:hypothetical protein ES703_40516 [subsurface metagenome]